MATEKQTRPLICLGEALVDLIRPDAAGEPEPHFGGALANVAVAASRAGAPSSLAGGCGDDARGDFLRERLRREGVGLEWHSVVEGLETPYAVAALDATGEPTFEIHDEGIEAGIVTLAGRETELGAAAGGVAVGSNTLVGEQARAITEEVIAAATASGTPVLFDPNLRPGRWRDLDAARSICLSLTAQATVLKCNLSEGRWLTGSEDPAGETAAALIELGPRLVVVTTGAEGAVARGAFDGEVVPPKVEAVSPLGAGDVFMGTLAAGLLDSDWTLEDAGPVLERAAAAGAEACTRLGAFE